MIKKKKCEFVILYGESKYNNIKWETGYIYSIKFGEPFNQHAQLKRWCEENCTDKIIYWESDTPWNTSDEIYFFCEADAAACKLRWI